MCKHLRKKIENFAVNGKFFIFAKTFDYMKKLALLLAIGIAAQASAQETPLWLRNTAISPDGKTIAFTYKGDVYTVPTTGGRAFRLTTNPAYDSQPIWSPDGTKIAFASDREGSQDIYIMDARGGVPRRLTTHSATETPLAFVNDTTVAFRANYRPSATYTRGAHEGQTYVVDIRGGRPRMFSSVNMAALSVAPDGRILYQDKKGFEDQWRKHERSSGTSDIWLVDGDKYTKLTSFPGHDLAPQWSADGKSFYYTSESDGTLNAYLRSLDGTERQLTKVKRHPVRSLSAAKNGTIAFSQDGEIWTLAPGAAEPQKVSVEIVTDLYDTDRVKDYRSSGATDIAVSPDGDEVAFVLRGDVYVTSTKYETTRRITNTDGQERVVAFSPDGKSLVYDSERDGLWRIYLAKIKEGKSFAYATEIEEELLYEGDHPAQQPAFSPDGKKVAFLSDRTELKVIDLKTRQVTTALDGKYNYSYSDGDVEFQWSPDSRWFLTSYIGVGGWNNSDIALVKADGTEVVDLTESGYSNSMPQWVLGGKGVAYTSGRYGMRSHGSWGEQDDVLLMMLDGEAWDDFLMTEEEAAIKEKEEADKKEAEDKGKDAKKDKKKDKDKKKGKKGDETDEDAVKPLEFDLANRAYRQSRLTAGSSSLAGYYVSPKADKLYYLSRGDTGTFNLYERNLKKGDTKVLASGAGYGVIVPDKKGENLFFLTGSGMKKISLSDGTSEPIAFSAEYSRTPSAERAYIFDHAVRQVADKFYDANIHGIDWKQYAEDYRRFLPHISNNADFAIMLSELLGELNASHTGCRYYSYGAPLSTASLGAFFDNTYEGDGLRVEEIIARGPLSYKRVGIAPGDIITDIDGTEIKAGTDYFPLLEGKAGKKTRIEFTKADGTKHSAIVKPRSSDSDLLYERWVKHNEDVVDSVSGGRVGYVHIQGMDSPSFREIYSKLLGKYRNCDAVVADTRFNGGGWLHNDVALLLSGKEYVRYTPRGKYIGSDPFSQWTKPSVMLVNEANYSDAHGTPYTYQTLGIGKVVGAPIPGTMTAVWWETQIDPTLVFGIPQVASLDRNGEVLENKQLTPDVIIYNNPGDELGGMDTQLIEATKTLLRDLDKK